MTAHLDQTKHAGPEVWFLTTELEGERAGGFRQERWCRIFLQAGFRIRILNLKGAFGFTDRTCATLSEFEAFRRDSLNVAPAVSSLREGSTSRLGRWIKHYLLADLYLPNVLSMLARASRSIRARTAPVLVMASSPPFSVALVGSLLKRRFPARVRLAIDMRDAWALHGALGGFRPLKRAIEGRVLRSADDVLTVSQWLAAEFAQSHGVTPRVMYNVATHYQATPPASIPVDWQVISPALRPDRLKIIYTGSTPPGHYDLASLVSAMVSLRRRDPSLANRLQLIFVGACSEVEAEALRQGVPAGDIVFVPHLPHALVRSVQANADMLLFYGHRGAGNKGVVSTKLFEYLSLGRPILPVCVHQGSDVDALLRRFCGAGISAHSPDELAALLAQIARDGAAGLPRRLAEDRTIELLRDYEDFATQAGRRLSAT